MESGARITTTYFSRLFKTKLIPVSQVCFSHSHTQQDRPQLTHLLILYKAWRFSLTASSADTDLMTTCKTHSESVIAVDICSCLFSVIHLRICDTQNHNIYRQMSMESLAESSIQNLIEMRNRECRSITVNLTHRITPTGVEYRKSVKWGMYF